MTNAADELARLLSEKAMGELSRLLDGKAMGGAVKVNLPRVGDVTPELFVLKPAAADALRALHDFKLRESASTHQVFVTGLTNKLRGRKKKIRGA